MGSQVYVDALSPRGAGGSVAGRVHTRRAIEALESALVEDSAAMTVRLRIFWRMVLDFARDNERFPTQAERIVEACHYRRAFDVMSEDHGFDDD